MDSSRALSAALVAALATTLLVALAPAANARTLYVANHASGSVSALEIAADGSLTPVAGSPFTAVSNTSGLSLAPDGAALVALSRINPGAVTAFTPAVDGALTAKSGVAPPSGNVPSYSTIDPSGRFLYVSNGSGLAADRTVSGFALAGSGMPTSLGAQFPGGGINMAGIATTVDGRFVYAGHNLGPGNVRGYSVGAGGLLTPLSGTPFNVGSGSSASIVVSPDGRFVFVGDQGSDAIAVAAIGANGELTPVGTPVGLGAGALDPENLAMTPDGRLVIAAASSGVHSLSVYRVATDGALTPAEGSPTALAGAPTGVAVTPDGRALYVGLGTSGNNVAGYSIGADGALTAFPGSPYASGANSSASGRQAVAIAPDQGPRAAFTAKAKSRTSRAVAFDGAASSDPDGKVAVYEWEFGDGKTATSTTPRVEHVYAKDGAYQAKLRVVDDEGCSASRIYTGQATLCNGGAAASATVAVTVDTPPVVSNVSVKKQVKNGKLAGLTIEFRVSEAGTARVGIERKSAGRRVGGRCVKPKRANRSRPKCDRYVSTITKSVKAKQAGPVSLKLGKKAVKRLKPGSYRVAITARDTTGKRTVKPVYKKFKVAKPKPPRR